MGTRSRILSRRPHPNIAMNSPRILCTAAIATWIAQTPLWLMAGMGLLMTATSPGQTANTNPVGFVTLSIQPGYNAIGPAMVNPPVFQSTVAGATGSSITFSQGATAVNLAGLLQPNTRYFVEISGPGTNFATYVGDVMEVDVAATIASANNVLTVKLAGFNTLNAPLPDLTGYSAMIRPHVTIGQVFGTLGNILLKGSGSAGSSDQVLFYDRATGGFTAYWFRANAGGTIAQWRSLDGADTTDYSTLPIEPGAGVFVLRQAANPAVDISFTGAVRTNDLQQPLASGFNLVAPALPVGHSPAMLKMNVAGGFIGAGSAGSADQILFLDPATGGYATYWFRANGSGSVQQWRSLDASNPMDYMNDTTLFEGTKAMFILKTAADPNYVYPISVLNLGN